jgi:hypothetical protein
MINGPDKQVFIKGYGDKWGIGILSGITSGKTA